MHCFQGMVTVAIRMEEVIHMEVTIRTVATHMEIIRMAAIHHTAVAITDPFNLL